MSLSDAADRALKKSQITLPGSQPFHIKFSISETTNPQSNRHAEVEEYWIAPDKYRRTIESPVFSQILIVNGAATYEKNNGDYYPYWLHQFIIAVFDPLPFAPALKEIHSELPSSLPGQNGTTCGDVHFRVDRWVICFNRNDSTFESIFTKGYNAQFKDYKKFGDKHVARRVITGPEYKSEIAAVISTLDSLQRPDESLFTVPTPTPPSERILFQRIGEDSMRSLVLGSSEIAWPTVVGGSPSGGCGAFLSADRAGNIREVFPEGCDNPGLDEPLRQSLLNWKLKQPVVNGVPVQVQSLMGFPFTVHVEPPPAVVELSNEEARKLATNITEPKFPAGSAPHGTKIEVQISVDDDGTLLGVNNLKNLGATFLAAYTAVRRWKFQPCIKDGKPVPFNANIVFTVP